MPKPHNELEAVTSLATVMNGTDLVAGVMRELSGETVSGIVDGVDITSEFGLEVIAVKISSELSSVMG